MFRQSFLNTNLKFKKYYLIIAIISLLITIFFGWYIITSKHQSIKEHVEQVLFAQEQLYKIHFKKTLETLEQLSSMYAGDKIVQDIFQKGRDAVESEGGGACLCWKTNM